MLPWGQAHHNNPPAALRIEAGRSVGVRQIISSFIHFKKLIRSNMFGLVGPQEFRPHPIIEGVEVLPQDCSTQHCQDSTCGQGNDYGSKSRHSKVTEYPEQVGEASSKTWEDPNSYDYGTLQGLLLHQGFWVPLYTVSVDLKLHMARSRCGILG